MEQRILNKTIDLNDLTSLLYLMADTSLELDTAVDQVLDKAPLASGVTRNSFLPQFLVTLPVFSWKLWLAGTAFLKTA